MLSTAILGLLNHRQVFYATKMAQLVTFEQECASLSDEDSNISYSENDEKDFKGKDRTNKSIYTDRIAKDLINSHDKVDKRMLKLHKIAENSSKSTDLIDYLGVKEGLAKSI